MSLDYSKLKEQLVLLKKFNEQSQEPTKPLLYPDLFIMPKPLWSQLGLEDPMLFEFAMVSQNKLHFKTIFGTKQPPTTEDILRGTGKTWRMLLQALAWSMTPGHYAYVHAYSAKLASSLSQQVWDWRETLNVKVNVGNVIPTSGPVAFPILPNYRLFKDHFSPPKALSISNLTMGAGSDNFTEGMDVVVGGEIFTLGPTKEKEEEKEEGYWNYSLTSKFKEIDDLVDAFQKKMLMSLMVPPKFLPPAPIAPLPLITSIKVVDSASFGSPAPLAKLSSQQLAWSKVFKKKT